MSVEHRQRRLLSQASNGDRLRGGGSRDTAHSRRSQPDHILQGRHPRAFRQQSSRVLVPIAQRAFEQEPRDHVSVSRGDRCLCQLDRDQSNRQQQIPRVLLVWTESNGPERDYVQLPGGHCQQRHGHRTQAEAY